MTITIALTLDEPQFGAQEFELAAYLPGQSKPFMFAQIFRVCNRFETSLSGNKATTSAERQLVAELATKVSDVCEWLEGRQYVNNMLSIQENVSGIRAAN